MRQFFTKLLGKSSRVSNQLEGQVIGNFQGGLVLYCGKEATPGRGATAAGVDLFQNPFIPCSIEVLHSCLVFTAVVPEYVAGLFQDH
jgi:hypothetical protein